MSLLMQTAVLLTPLVWCAIGCGRDEASGLATVNMQIGTKQFTLEVADTDVARAKGLMRRDSMPKLHGMIFVFARAEPQAFWMKHTRIPLDIIYLDADGKVVSIHQMKPYDLNTTPSAGPAKYAIELNKGMAAEAGVKAGDVLVVPKEAREPKE